MGIINCTPATQREERLREVRKVNIITVVVTEEVGVETNKDDSKKVWAYTWSVSLVS